MGLRYKLGQACHETASLAALCQPALSGGSTQLLLQCCDRGHPELHAIDNIHALRETTALYHWVPSWCVRPENPGPRPSRTAGNFSHILSKQLRLALYH